jgi:hypothetical protein
MPKTKIRTPLISIFNEKPDLRKREQPLLDIKVTNPITYLKSFWKRVLGNEGIDFRFRIKPLTAIAISVVVAAFGFGIGNISPPVIENAHDTAFIGMLYYAEATQKHYLITNDSEAINLVLPTDLDARRFYKQGVLVEGNYKDTTNTLTIATISHIN